MSLQEVSVVQLAEYLNQYGLLFVLAWFMLRNETKMEKFMELLQEMTLAIQALGDRLKDES